MVAWTTWKQGSLQETIGLWIYFQGQVDRLLLSLQSCPTLCDPIYGSPPGSSIPGIFQARVPEWGAIAFSKVDRTPDRFRVGSEIKELTLTFSLTHCHASILPVT